MSIYNKYKMALAFRKLYNGLCSKCKKNMIRHTKAGRMKGRDYNEIGRSAEDFVCEKCKRHLVEVMTKIRAMMGK